MGNFNMSLITITVFALSISHGFAIPPPLDPVDKCIYACIYCFKDNIGVICANECLATEGQMHLFWYKTCPQLGLPHFFWKSLELSDEKISPNGAHENLLH